MASLSGGSDHSRISGQYLLHGLQLADITCSVDRAGSMLTGIHTEMRKQPVCQVYPCLKDLENKVFRTPGVVPLAGNKNNLDSIIPCMNMVAHSPRTKHKSNLDVQGKFLSFPLGLGFSSVKWRF